MNTTTANRLTHALRELHRELLASTERGHAKLFGAKRSPYERLALYQDDPLFAWLKPLTGAVAELDDALDHVEEPARLEAALQAVTRLLWGQDPAFGPLYTQALQGSPEVAVAHGAASRELRALGLKHAA
ncbi:MAG: hypothetical protein JST54_00090 [Deltaproteobacteria bacterium]|nr:hypothetical protein [Deltaproteobacteria bacterium]